MHFLVFFFFKQKTAYEMRISDWSSDVCSSDLPRTRPDLPNHEPRGCSRGASYSWYLYSGNRVKYPLVRSRLVKLWRAARATMTPVAAWKSIVEDPEKRKSYTSKRGLGGRSAEHTSELQSLMRISYAVFRLKKKNTTTRNSKTQTTYA